MKTIEDEDDLERCRRARKTLDSRFKSLGEQFDFLKKLERKGGKRMAHIGRAKAMRVARRRVRKTVPQSPTSAKRIAAH